MFDGKKFKIYNDNIKVYEYGNITDKPYYDIGSLSKTFTSLLILKAVHQGLINLDDEINNLEAYYLYYRIDSVVFLLMRHQRHKDSPLNE